MKTKLNFNERQNLIAIKNQLASMYFMLKEEWVNDTNKYGYVKLHSKTKKCLNRASRAYDDIMWLLKQMELER